MHKSSQIPRQQEESPFVKGMTLDEYMSKNKFESPQSQEDPQIAEQQNLYESSGHLRMEGIKTKNRPYLIDEIDEESIQDSIENYYDQQNPVANKNQRTKQTLVQNNETNENPWRNRVSSISMNATAFFKTSNHDKNTFRIKHMSISPYKRKTQSPLLEGGGSITLYGNKFGQNLNKNASKIPQLVTFYGKLNHNNDEKMKRETFNTNTSFKKKESRHNFQKKNQLELNELIEFESKIKNNYSHKNYLQQFKVEGIKDRLVDRKNKFC